MSRTTAPSVICHLRRAALAGGEGPTDAALLEAFVLRQDEAAFAALVRRHGPMVLAVCRRVVGHEAEADDAFQAVFLVLARKADTLAEPHLLAGWLHGVATRIALEARTRMLRRTASQRPLIDCPESAGESDAERSELLAMLDRELNRLADKYRLPVVLCELEGRSRKEVAERLGIPEGTLSSRLATARRMLAERMRRRGLAVTTTAVGTALAQQASAAVPAPLVHATVAGAASGSVPAGVAALTEGVLKAVFLRKLQLSMVLVAVLGLGTGLFTLGALGGKPAILNAQDKPTPTDHKPDQPASNSLLGGWKITSATFGGREVPVDSGPTAFYFAKDKGFLLYKIGGVQFKYETVPSAKPATINLTPDPTAVVRPTPNANPKLQGIYELSGDKLKFAFSQGMDERPTVFESKEGSRTVLLVLTRDPSIKEPDPKTFSNKAVQVAAARMKSSNNLKQIGLAMHNYADTFRTFPSVAIMSQDGKPLLSWRVALLPFIEQDALYKQFKLDEPWDSEHNKKLLAQMPKIYGNEGTKTHYRVFQGGGALFEQGKRIDFAQITDGTSNTIMVVEAPEAVEWTKPEAIDYSADKPVPKLGGKPFENGFLTLFADGSVRFISDKIEEKLLRALITRMGGEMIPLNMNEE